MKKIITYTIMILISIWMIFQGGCYLFWNLMAWSGPKVYNDMVKKTEALPPEEIIKKLHSFDMFSPYPNIAINVLAEKEEKKAVPELIELMKSWNRNTRRDAIWALSVIDDRRAIKPLMDIVEKGEKNSNYLYALDALSRMRYEGAYKYIVERAKEPDAYRNGSVGMLKKYGKPESIPLLLEIRNNIKDSDPMSKAGRSEIDKVITYIESLK